MALTSLLLSMVCNATSSSEGDSGGFCAELLAPDQRKKKESINLKKKFGTINPKDPIYSQATGTLLRLNAVKDRRNKGQ